MLWGGQGKSPKLNGFVGNDPLLGTIPVGAIGPSIEDNSPEEKLSIVDVIVVSPQSSDASIPWKFA